MQFGLNGKTIRKMREVLRKYPQVSRAIIFGSRAKGNYKNGSDIDLTLLGDEELTLDVLRQIMNDMEELLLPYMIDLSIYHQIMDAEIKDHIDRVGKLFYER